MRPAAAEMVASYADEGAGWGERGVMGATGDPGLPWRAMHSLGFVLSSQGLGISPGCKGRPDPEKHLSSVPGQVSGAEGLPSGCYSGLQNLD